jgi:uncharacterized surface protein with fasciclin (FAS1) repeats
MHTCIKRAALCLAAATVLFGCKKKFDDYYDRPDNLEQPIYQQLQARGNFTQFLSLIDKSGYKQTLSAAGYWTIFAPSDSAFQADNDFKAYLQARNFSSVSAVDSATAQSIVQYLLVFNGFNKDRIDDYQANTGWLADNAFKRRTAYYTGFYKDTLPSSQVITAVPSNRNNLGGNSYYVAADNNNKFIPFFTDAYFASRALSASDYNYFYPGTAFTDFNVVNAKVTQRNIAAENGVIHLIDKVVTPLPSLDQYLRTKPEYSEMKKLFDQLMVQFLQNNDATHRYQVLTGSTDNVFVKVYSNLLAFSPNNENYFKLQDNDGQREGWTLAVPRNDSLLSYINRVLLEHYPSVTSLPLSVIADLLNAHMWQSTVWPSKFNTTFNFVGEPFYSNPATDIIDKKMLSNGVLYGTTKVNEPNVFSTVYGKAYLDPKFSLMTRLMDYDIRTIVTNPTAKFTLFMMPNQVLGAQGYGYDPAANVWRLNNVGNDTNRLNLMRILNSNLVETPNGELDNIGTPGFRAIMSTYGGEVLKFEDNKIISAGNTDRGIVATIDSIKKAKNGQVVYLNNLTYFTYNPIPRHLEALGAPAASEYNLFWNYFKNSNSYDIVTNSIVGTAGGSFYTIMVPNNAAMRAAITAGLLPGTAAAPVFNPTSSADKVLVEKFIQYHVVDKRTLIPDKRDIGVFPTLLKNSSGDSYTISIAYPGNVFEISDMVSRKARIVGLNSELSNRTVIHLLDNYLKYN